MTELTYRVTYENHPDQYVTVNERAWITEISDVNGNVIYEQRPAQCWMNFNTAFYKSVHGIYDPYFYAPV